MARQLDEVSVVAVPSWAKFLDGIALLTLLLFASVAGFGGARFYFGAYRLSLTSPVRILLFALAILAIRHLIVRRDPIHRRMAAALRRLWFEDAARAAAIPFVLTRPMVLVVGFLAVVIVGYPSWRPSFRISRNEWVNLPARWDTGWYLGIATSGYTWDPLVKGQQNVAFFPAYPILMRAVGTLIGARPTRGQDLADLEAFQARLLLAGLCVSFIAFFWACRYLFRLGREQLGDERARATLLLLASYPFAVFFSAAYTESLFLLATVAAFYHMRRDELAAAAAWGLVAGLSRPNGFLLTAPLVLLALQRRWSILAWPMTTRHAGQRSEYSSHRLWPGIVAALMPCIGMLVYSAYVYQLTGNPFTWAHAQRAWGRTYSGLSSVIVQRYDYVVARGFYEYAAGLPVDVVNSTGAVLALALLWPITTRLGSAFALHVALLVLPPMAAGGMLSMGRISSVAFPMFAALAVVVPPRVIGAVACSFAVLQGLVATAFFTWRPLY